MRICKHSLCPYWAAKNSGVIEWSSRASRLHTFTRMRTIALWPFKKHGGLNISTAWMNHPHVSIPLSLPYKQPDGGRTSRTQCVSCWPQRLSWPAAPQSSRSRPQQLVGEGGWGKAVKVHPSILPKTCTDSEITSAQHKHGIPAYRGQDKSLVSWSMLARALRRRRTTARCPCFAAKKHADSPSCVREFT